MNLILVIICLILSSDRSLTSPDLSIHTGIFKQSQFYSQQLVSEQFDLSKNKNGEEICGRRNGNFDAISQIIEDKLSKTNYRVWSMTMDVYLDSHDMWQTIVGENPTKKKDRQALSAIMSGVPEDLLGILDAKKTAKENWEILRQRNLGMDRVIQSRIQGLRWDLEMLTMSKSDLVVDFVMKFMHIVSDLRNLGEAMEEKEVVRRFLRVTPAEFDALTLSLEQYGELDKVSLDEVIGSFTVHELWLKEWESREEERSY